MYKKPALINIQENAQLDTHCFCVLIGLGF